MVSTPFEFVCNDMTLPFPSPRAAVAFQLVTWLDKLAITASRKKQPSM
jgi:hypothetical protein